MTTPRRQPEPDDSTPAPPRREQGGHPKEDRDHDPAVGLTVELIRKAKGGDRAALGDLISRLGPWIENLVRREWHRTRGAYTPEDMESTLLAHVVSKIEAFEGAGRGQFKKWIRKLCNSKVHEVLRRIRSMKRDDRREVRLPTTMEIVGTGDSPQHASIRENEVADLHTALARLDVGDRLIIEDHDLKGVPLATIAGRLGITEMAAKKRLHRARIKLRRIMAGLGHGDDKNTVE